MSSNIPDARLKTVVAGLELANPVMVASGTFGYGQEYADYIDLNRLGAVMVKGVSTEPWLGNPVPRIAETASGMLNAIGLQNPGVDGFVSQYLPWLQKFDAAVIVNVIGRTVDEYVEVVRRLAPHPGIAAVELNISCPNIKEGGLAFGVDPDMAAQVTRAVVDASPFPVIPKLSPNVTDIQLMAKAVESAGAHAVSLVNTFMAMAIDVHRKRPVLANTFGGLSGPAIKPMALRMVWQVYEAVKIPIIGMGGIINATDALEFMMAGAAAVALGTANFVDPSASLQVVAGLARYVEEHDLDHISNIVGAAHPH